MSTLEARADSRTLLTSVLQRRITRATSGLDVYNLVKISRSSDAGSSARWRSLSPFHLFTLDVGRLKLLGSIKARVLNFWRDTRLINAALITEREILASSLAVSCFIFFSFLFFRLCYTSSLSVLWQNLKYTCKCCENINEPVVLPFFPIFLARSIMLQNSLGFSLIYIFLYLSKSFFIERVNIVFLYFLPVEKYSNNQDGWLWVGNIALLAKFFAIFQENRQIATWFLWVLGKV